MDEKKLVLEACCTSAEQVFTAAKFGADRVELCENLEIGGTTPSDENIRLSVTSGIPVNVLVRPRGGDFIYSPEEEEQMAAAIERCRGLGAAGVVIGALLPDGSVDSGMMKRLVEKAHGSNGQRRLSVTFHRAIDECADPFQALETIIGLGFDRILTSGHESGAVGGSVLLAELVRRAAGRIIIMPGGGVTAENVEKLAEITGATEFHGTRICM
ncbi:MAG: copper homeostasis protein CutC [Bacteroidales bacterium]|nr:copper homeostasis protein CutC [Candidatus Hennigimonas equi]